MSAVRGSCGIPTAGGRLGVSGGLRADRVNGRAVWITRVALTVALGLVHLGTIGCRGQWSGVAWASSTADAQDDARARYASRYEREAALKQGGGSDQTEWAVILALRWLKEHQNEDGSWGEEPLQPSMTGLALLCFLGHGEDNESEEFGTVVRKALEWLKGNQDAEGLLARGDGKPVAYQHGIATYALAEAYAMTGLEPLHPVVKDAIKVILQGQTDEGG